MINWTSVGVQPNIDAERAVIGAIIASPEEVMPEAEQLLDEHDFFFGEYRTLFRTCSGYFVDGKDIDVVTLIAQHGDDYKVIISDAVGAMPSVRNWKSYAQIVIDVAKRRRAYESAEILLENLSAGAEIEECQHWAVRASEHLSGGNNDNTVSAKDGFFQFYSSLQKPVDYIGTGFSHLDKHIFIERGDFVVVGARPSVGKTALTLQIMLHMAKSRRVAYFSLETRNNNLFGRMAANLSGVGLRDIKTRELDTQRLLQAREIFEKLDFYTVEAAGWSVAQIKAKAVQLGAEVVFVDYLGLVRAEGKSLYERVTNVSAALHTMALSSKMAVIALCQLNREGRGEPDMTHLRESGQIEQDADAILLIHAPEKVEDRSRKIIIAKNKEGKVGAVEFDFNGSIQRFSEYESRYA